MFNEWLNDFTYLWVINDVQAAAVHVCDRKKKKRKDYTFRRQFHEKPSIIPGCPGTYVIR